MDRRKKGVPMNFLKNKYARVVTAFLVLQLFAFYALASRHENVPAVGPLAMFPSFIGPWTATKEFTIDQETLDVLRADDTLDRWYVDEANHRDVVLFIAFFKTQRAGQSPHSPRNCLPGSGWEPIPGMSSHPALPVPGEAQPIVINRYVTQQGENQSVTLYWYQSHNRIIADEFAAKFWSIADSVRYHRSDTAIVKVTISVANGDIARATQTGYDFVQAMFPALLRQLPN
jgi:EpsI family protein